MAFGRAINDPDLVGVVPQISAHLLEAGTVEKTRHSNEANDAAPRRRRRRIRRDDAAAEHLPRRPAPEVDIEVAQMLGVGPDAPYCRRQPIPERLDTVLGTALDPAALAPCPFLVGRIADHH